MKNKIIKVAIICELKERELQFLSVLKKKIELNGYKVKIIPQRILCGLKILIFRPDIIIINGLRSDSSFYRQMFIPKIIFHSLIISLYSEQIGKHGRLSSTYDSPKILDNVDAHVAWGEGFAKGLTELGVPHEKIWILGSMALDLSYYIDNGEDKIKNLLAEIYNLDKSKKWILVSDNIVRNARQVHYYDIIRKEFNDGIKKIAEKLDDCEFIFRPHPENKKRDLKKLYCDFCNYPNIKIISDEHNILWSSLSEAMIVWRSTSSIEAWVVGKEVFALQTSENEFDYWHSKFMPNFKSADELSKELKKYLEKIDRIDDKLIINREEYMRKWFYKVDGESFDRISHLIDIIQGESPSELKAEKCELVGILKAYLLEVQWVVSKLLKREYKRFNIKDTEVAESLKYIKALFHSRNNYHIKHTKFGNYLIPIK